MNKGTLAKNVAKVEAKEKELAEAKAKAKVRCHSFVSALPVPPLPPHPSALAPLALCSALEQAWGPVWMGRLDGKRSWVAMIATALSADRRRGSRVFVCVSACACGRAGLAVSLQPFRLQRCPLKGGQTTCWVEDNRVLSDASTLSRSRLWT